MNICNTKKNSLVLKKYIFFIHIANMTKPLDVTRITEKGEALDFNIAALNKDVLDIEKKIANDPSIDLKTQLEDGLDDFFKDKKHFEYVKFNESFIVETDAAANTSQKRVSLVSTEKIYSGMAFSAGSDTGKVEEVDDTGINVENDLVAAISSGDPVTFTFDDQNLVNALNMKANANRVIAKSKIFALFDENSSKKEGLHKRRTETYKVSALV
jgi:hypothetical protein